MDYTLIVQIVIGITILFLILFNIYLYFNDVENDTVNFLIKRWAYHKYFFLTTAWGILGGHFFLGTEVPLLGPNAWLPVVLVVVLLIALLIIGLKQDKDFVMKRRIQLLLLILGVIYGHFFWSQRHLDYLDIFN
ncbi:hypothetical protein CLV86_2044 [Lacinutrix venerupis]|uniref:Uncharacterized protein n=1 Tax=Lacinutrix venerupis TaxID=1486034 RepID=A0AAC9LJG8_9FLAO|nr:hypothetical protein [Lacinutrix venerupis]APX99775.1 hypothetical protein BWR22_05440 [Lacinutrix venerupis]RLJ62439.1 hypothetical protein CLV86_2044 [Lacinutrix venerupis]